MNSGLHEHIKAFVAIAQAGSLTGASISIGIAQATLSRQLAALEAHLGCRLFQRSTRAISLTEQGEVYLQHALRLLALNEEAESAVQQESARLRGRLRVACSNGFGRKLLIPALGQWMALHPQLRLELRLSDQLSQLIEDQVDVAIRIAPLQNSSLVARPVGVSRRIVVATPAYLRKHGPITSPAHLQQHQCLLFADAQQPGVWTFEGPQGKTSVRVDGRLMLSSVDALQDAVLCGLGIAVTPEWFWQRERIDGHIVQLLPTYRLQEQTIHAMTTSRAAGAGKVRQFVDYVAQCLSAVGAGVSTSAAPTAVA
ncbi:MAG TPA: LysR substrate-binding domain-containing protein [Ideonella sp.]|uniref:LysR family transcriptional regulator n=1 Tax=Ideonella sp. TaxID=1929293 RepID=UPI002E312142|nr:LysR substrate-binding domain-containing protein [Ideonella sp.]HEX5682785.1 LysR substrate-binding domain-containing protein [Ideonella sp.]